MIMKKRQSTNQASCPRIDLYCLACPITACVSLAYKPYLASPAGGSTGRRDPRLPSARPGVGDQRSHRGARDGAASHLGDGDHTPGRGQFSACESAAVQTWRQSPGWEPGDPALVQELTSYGSPSLTSNSARKQGLGQHSL